MTCHGCHRERRPRICEKRAAGRPNKREGNLYNCLTHARDNRDNLELFGLMPGPLIVAAVLHGVSLSRKLRSFTCLQLKRTPDDSLESWLNSSPPVLTAKICV